MPDPSAALTQLIWTPLMLIFLGVGILSKGAIRVVSVSAAIGGSVCMGMVLIALVVAS